MRITLSWLVVGIIPLAACSSVPDFKPSRPLEEASSLAQALDICAEYQIPGEQNAAGRALPERVSVLVPWIRCFEDVFRKFPEVQDREDFVSFFRALQERYDGVQPADAKVIDWPTMNFAINRVIEHLKQPRLPYSAEERRVIEKNFPDFSIHLAEAGAFSNKTARSSLTTQMLEDQAGVADAQSAQTGKNPPRAMPLSPEQREYCKRYRNYARLSFDLKELQEYSKVLEEQTYGDVSNTRELEKKNRLKNRVDALEKETNEKQSQLSKDFVALQARSKWFRNGHCLND
ncbi:MAG: hypothetical protein AB1540_01540 [Bdellovibrionota bacterium]